MRDQIQSVMQGAVTRLLSDRNSAVAKVYRSMLDLATRHHAILLEEPTLGAGSIICTLVATELLGIPASALHTQQDFLLFPSDGIPIKKEVMQEALARLSKGAISERRVVVWEDISRLNTASANAFLKTLEEPDSRTIFLLTTPSIERVLPTISSRAIPIHLPHAQEITEEILASSEHKDLFNELSLGRPLLAAALVAEQKERKRALQDLLKEFVAIAGKLISIAPGDQLDAYARILALKDMDTGARKKQQSFDLPIRPMHLLCLIIEGTIEKMLHSTMMSAFPERATAIAGKTLQFRQDINQNMSLKLAALDLVFGTTNNTL